MCSGEQCSIDLRKKILSVAVLKHFWNNWWRTSQAKFFFLKSYSPLRTITQHGGHRHNSCAPMREQTLSESSQRTNMLKIRASDEASPASLACHGARRAQTAVVHPRCFRRAAHPDEPVYCASTTMLRRSAPNTRATVDNVLIRICRADPAARHLQRLATTATSARSTRTPLPRGRATEAHAVAI
jgi:hypothetical protein